MKQKLVNEAFHDAFIQFEIEMTGTHKPPWTPWPDIVSSLAKILKLMPTAKEMIIEFNQNIKIIQNGIKTFQNNYQCC